MKSFEFELNFMKAHNGQCRECCLNNKPLERAEGYYVPWEKVYYFGKDHKETRHDKRQDIHVKIPQITFCEKHNKFKIEFTDVDEGGYDTMLVVRYYDTLEELLADMGVDLKTGELK